MYRFLVKKVLLPVIALLGSTLFGSTLFGSTLAWSEETLLLNESTEATWNASKAKSPQACVLMIHGWVSSMDEVGGMFKRLAQQLAENNIASIRVNVRGESEGERSQYRLTSTFQSRIEDAQRGYDYLTRECVAKPIGVVGFSLGGATAIALAGNINNSINSLVLWSSAVNPSEIFTNIKPQKNIRDVIEEGEGIFNEFTDITVTKQHYLGMQGYEPLKTLHHYSGGLLTVRGTEDFVPMHDLNIVNSSSSNHAEVRLIKGANHIFNTFDANNQSDEQVIDYSKQWFLNTLGLISP